MVITVLSSKATATAFRSNFSVAISSALVASSSTMILDRWRIARAMQSSCSWPAEKFSPPSRTSRPTSKLTLITSYCYFKHMLLININNKLMLFINITLHLLILHLLYYIILYCVLNPSGCEAMTSLICESSKACQISWSSCSENGSRFSLRTVINFKLEMTYNF